MTFWLVRAGRHGEREDFALENNVVAIGWDSLDDLSQIQSRDELLERLIDKYPDKKENSLKNWRNQIWTFVKRIQPGDLVALPLKGRSMIALGRITSGYRFEANNPNMAQHIRPVEWIDELPRSSFGQDLLYSLGSAMTVCQIQRNNAEERVNNILLGEKDTPIKQPEIDSDDFSDDSTFDLEQYSRDQIVAFINSKFKGHDLQRLAAAVLESQGYIVKISPDGPDGGVDIIAGKGSLGFEEPRLVVQVKSSDSPVDVSVLRELQGVMSSFGAELGLIVAWGGYKGTVEKESIRHFFKIRLWDANDLVQMIQENYDLLEESIQAELPLKRIWTLVFEEDE